MPIDFPFSRLLQIECNPIDFEKKKKQKMAKKVMPSGVNVYVGEVFVSKFIAELKTKKNSNANFFN